MFINQLMELGLTENEAKVYIALLELDQTTTGSIIKKSGLYRVIVYDILDKLLEKGLVTYAIKKNIKHFQAENPDKILSLLEEKQNIAKQLIPQLEKLKPIINNNNQQDGAFIYEGWNGIKAAQENYFKSMNKTKKQHKGEYLMIGASRQLHKHLDAYFNYFHERRAKLKIPAKLLFNENNKQFAKLKSKYNPVQLRFMPKKIITPSWISTYEDMVLIGVSEDQPMAFFIRNRAVAESYKQYFYWMWQMSKNI